MSTEKTTNIKEQIKIYEAGRMQTINPKIHIDDLTKKIEEVINNEQYGTYDNYLGYEIVTAPVEIFPRGSKSDIMNTFIAYVSYRVQESK